MLQINGVGMPATATHRKHGSADTAHRGRS